MAVESQVFPLIVGQQGLVTDNPQNQSPPSSLIRAVNLDLNRSMGEKALGSSRFNVEKFASGVRSFIEFDGKVYSVLNSGKVFSINNGFASPVEVLANASSDPTLLKIREQPHLELGGQEAQNNPRKLFIFTGESAVQVISEGGTTRSNLSTPATDWGTNNQPTFGIVHRDILFAFGNKSNPHRIYASDPTDQEDFTSGSAFTASIYPGDAQKLVSAFVYKGKLFLVKFPKGIYILNDTDTNTANWFFSKVSGEFGGSSAHCATPLKDDVFIANSTGSVTSVAAAFQLGDIEAADVLNLLRNESFMREITNQSGSDQRWAITDFDKRQALFAYQSSASDTNDRILVLDFATDQIKTTWFDKDQPTCFAFITDVKGIQRPAYGAKDGFIYLLNSPNAQVEGLNAPRNSPNVELSGSSGNLSAGQYQYGYTFSDGSSETSLSPIGFQTNRTKTFVDGNVNTGTEFIAITDHSYPNAANIRLESTGTLPAGLSLNTDYFIVGRTDDTFQLSLTLGGSAVNITAAASGGTHTVKPVKCFAVEVFDAGGDSQMNLTGISVDVNSVATERKIYRTIAGGSAFLLLATIADNSTTTFTDNVADGSLGAAAPTSNGFHSAYKGELQTPHLDMGDRTMKIFEALELTFEPSGNWNVTVEAQIDGKYFQTITFDQAAGSGILGSMALDDSGTTGKTSARLSGRIPVPIKKPLKSRGRFISFKITNNVLGQSFKIQDMLVYYKPGAQDNRAR